MGLALSSPAFAPGGEIPTLFTCEGRDLSPALDWTGVPEAAQSLVLIVDDPDAPDPKAPKMTWVHWVLYNLPASATGIAGDEARHGLPAGTLPLLVMDLYEHAYAIDYGAGAAKYVDAFFANLAWDMVERRYELARRAFTLLTPSPHVAE